MSACGRNDILNTQEGARDDMKEELLGTWTTPAEASRVRKVTVDKDKITFEVTYYREVECKNAYRTVTHSGVYKLAHNYKSGIENSIIFTPDNDVVVTLHEDADVKAQNGRLVDIRNSKQAPISETDSDLTVKQTMRNNEKLVEGQKILNWLKGEPKSLNRMQLEKLNEAGLSAAGVAEQGARVSIRYELDNSFLQLGDAATSGQTAGYGFGLSGVFAK